MSGAGHNQLADLIGRIENLNEERAGLLDDANAVYAEAKVLGYDTKTLRELIRLRKLDPADAKARRALLDDYAERIGLDLL